MNGLKMCNINFFQKEKFLTRIGRAHDGRRLSQRTFLRQVCHVLLQRDSYVCKIHYPNIPNRGCNHDCARQSVAH